MEKTLKESLIVFGISAGLLASGITGLNLRCHNERQKVKENYNQLIVIESKKNSKEELTALDTLEFYNNHRLMPWAIYEFSDLIRGDANRWIFEEVPYSEKERIVKEHKK